MLITSNIKSLIIGIFSSMAASISFSQTPKGEVDYFTEYGILTFNFQGKKVSGFYPHERGRISGFLKDSLLAGSWSQSDGGGEIEVRFNADFSKFKISYNHSATPDSTGKIWKKDWTGMRKPETIVRKYKSFSGTTVTLNFTGTQIEGTYPWYNGKLLGEISGYEFTGIWLQSNRGFGTIKLTFSEDFKSFTGKYNDFNFHPDKWLNWNGKIYE